MFVSYCEPLHAASHEGRQYTLLFASLASVMLSVGRPPKGNRIYSFLQNILPPCGVVFSECQVTSRNTCLHVAQDTCYVNGPVVMRSILVWAPV